jgi:hypothetical protein
MLMGVVVTILISRIAETQFFVKVTINDLWGAIAVGFVINYYGPRVLGQVFRAPGNQHSRSNGIGKQLPPKPELEENISAQEEPESEQGRQT